MKPPATSHERQVPHERHQACLQGDGQSHRVQHRAVNTSVSTFPIYITYILTGAGFLYLVVVLDAWSRRIVGWAMETHLLTDLGLAALDMAMVQRLPPGVIHHSDEAASTSIAYGQRCREFGVRPSMGSVGDAYDNAMCESFFATPECELLCPWVPRHELASSAPSTTESTHVRDDQKDGTGRAPAVS